MLMRRAVRQTRVAAGGQASEHRARATWVNMLLCACWRVTHLFLSLRFLFLFFALGIVLRVHITHANTVHMSHRGLSGTSIEAGDTPLTELA